MRVRWKKKPCGCVNTMLPSTGPVTIRCQKHRGKKTKKGRALVHFNEDGLVRHG